MHTKEKEESRSACFRIEPEKQLCPIYDEVGIRTFPVAEPDEMGFRVVDDFVQEHIQQRPKQQYKGADFWDTLLYPTPLASKK